MNISTKLNISKLLMVAIVVSGISLFTTSCEPEIVEIVNPVNCDSTAIDSTYNDTPNPNDSTIVNNGDGNNNNDSTNVGGNGGTYPEDSTGTGGTYPNDSTGFGG